ncbi:MAG: SdpI family protein [Oscillospiraceae bacterium]|nr:SdpI family protein [Oscillospiraceae bacterium]
MQILLILNLIVPGVMLLVGGILKWRPAVDMSRNNGYNTPVSRRSREHWDYAQKAAPGVFIAWGVRGLIVEALMSLVFLLAQIPVASAVAIGEGIGFIFLICGFCDTDRRIKNKFMER